VINSFSKYHCMTGWRIGWCIVPPALRAAMRALQQNLFINAPTISQHSAAAAFDCDEELAGRILTTCRSPGHPAHMTHRSSILFY
jgi:aspartate/methionine/tyrosine aminotransferase